MDILDKFKEEIVEDVKVDELNLLDKQMMLPSLKHKWVARLIDAKRELNRLNRKKKQLRESVLEQFKKEGIPPGIPKANIDKKIDSSETIMNLQEEIEEKEIIVEYLEKVETIFKNMSFDLKNIVEINKMEMS
jgi:phenylalanyl-tRNA synthetase alpha subunit